MKFTLESLQLALQAIQQHKGFSGSAILGLSGGMDSIALLNALTELRDQGKLGFEFRALHVNHGLQSGAGNWQQLCEKLCANLSVELKSVAVDIDLVDPQSSSGLENAAREARYAVFKQQLQPGEVLLLAHHRDDQMETMLLHLMRGSGVKGLRGIPRTREVAAGFLFRPLLDFERQAILAYADDRQLLWVEDPSNQDQNFDRNYCRHTLLPAIESRWPGYRQSWSKTASLAAESEELLADLAQNDLLDVGTESAAILRVDRLLLLGSSRRRNVLRHWLGELNLPELGWNRLQQLSEEVLLASDTASITGVGFRLARFKGCLYALRGLEQELPRESEQNLSWDVAASNKFELTGNGSLQAEEVSGGGLAIKHGLEFQIRYRQGGEDFHMAGRPNKSLKKVLQESEVEPWLRSRVPLLYKDNQLVCVPGIGVSDDYVATAEEPGLHLHWFGPKFEVNIKSSE